MIAKGFASGSRREGESWQACAACGAPARTGGSYADALGGAMVVPWRRRATTSPAQRTSERRVSEEMAAHSLSSRPVVGFPRPNGQIGPFPRDLMKCPGSGPGAWPSRFAPSGRRLADGRVLGVRFSRRAPMSGQSRAQRPDGKPRHALDRVPRAAAGGPTPAAAGRRQLLRVQFGGIAGGPRGSGEQRGQQRHHPHAAGGSTRRRYPVARSSDESIASANRSYSHMIGSPSILRCPRSVAGRALRPRPRRLHRAGRRR